MTLFAASVDPWTAGHVAVALKLYRDRCGAQHLDAPDAQLAELQALFQSSAVSGLPEPSMPQWIDDVADDDGMTTLLLPLDEIPRHLRVSASTVERLVREGTLPTVKVGRRRLVRPADLEAYVNSLPVETGSAA